MPPVELDVLELADPGAPYGLRGVGEPPTISSTPAIVAALRAATGAHADPRAGPSRRHRGPVMPVPPAELTAEFSVAGPEAAQAAGAPWPAPPGWRARPGPASRR